MNESQGIRPDWMKLNTDVDHFDPFEGLDKLEEEIRHIRYGINICNQNLLFDKTILCEATINSNVHPIPNVPTWISGMINLRGNLIPVFRIDEFLTDSKEKVKHNKIVFVIGQGTDAVGLLISELPVAVEIDEENVDTITPPADTPEIFSESINAAYEIDEKIWLEIDIYTVINNLESLNQ